MEGQAVPFYSVQDLLLNQKTHIALNWLSQEGELQIEVYQPAQVNSSVGGYLLAGTICFPGARQWIQALVESRGQSDLFMHVSGVDNEQPRARPLTVSKEDHLRLTYDREGLNMKVEVHGERQGGPETLQGSLYIPITAVMEFFRQITEYEGAVTDAILAQHPPVLADARK